MGIDFHSHEWQGVPVTIPGPVRECQDPQCREEREAIERIALWPRGRIKARISAYQELIARDMSQLTILREALQLHDKDSNV